MENNSSQVVLVKDINPGSGSSSIYDLGEFNDKLYFSANDGENGRELWVSDGTTEGTQLVKDINPGSSPYGYPNSSSPSSFTKFNNKLYFQADDGENGSKLWVSDGTTEGTQLVEDINPGGGYYGASYPKYLIESNDQLYFTADDNENGRELWVSDGTSEGTQLVKDINFGTGGSSPSGFTEFNDKLYFRAEDSENGIELWVSDGTTEGTQLVKDINPGSNYSFPRYLTEFNDKLYFGARDNENGDELRVSDGTTEGTQLVKNIVPGSGGSFPLDLIESNNKLYFTARDNENGRELWVSDGTTAGTHLVDDINLGSDDSFPVDLIESNNKLYFTADDGENGRELFKLIVDDSTTINIITGTNGSDNLVGTDGADQIEGGNGRDILTGSDGNDTLLGGNGKDILTGGAGNDLLDGGNGRDILTGNGGNDTLLGGNGKDILTGGAGNDLLDGGDGKDILTGGAGEDIFVLRCGEGKDSITDFELGSDSVTVYFSERLGSAGLKFNDLTLTGNTLKVGDELLATFTGVDTEQLTAADFDQGFALEGAKCEVNALCVPTSPWERRRTESPCMK